MTAETGFDFGLEDDGDDGQQAGNASPSARKLGAAYEKAKKEAKDNAARAEKAERELAFAKAGLDLSDKKVKYFIAGYDGELDADKIKSAAVEDGFLPDPNAKEEEAPEPSTQEHPDTGGFNAMDDATTGSSPAASSPDLVKGMSEIYEKGGGADEVAQFLRAHGHPVTEGD